MIDIVLIGLLTATLPHTASANTSSTDANVVAPVSHASRAARRWDAVGHRAMAAVAYDRLRPATRARVDALLRQHPDLERLSDGLDAASTDGIREVFLRASVWPDRIRGDDRFYNETDSRSTPTPLLPGYPTMARRGEWHYLPRSFSTDTTAPTRLPEPNVATMVPALADAMADEAIPASVRAYNLTWLIHVVGDLHQPMHGTSRSTPVHPNGDAGGNRVWVELPGINSDSVNLHAVWDGWVGRLTRDMPVDDVARTLVNALPMPTDQPRDELDIPRGAALAATVQAWADESATLARYVAYDLPPRNGGPPPRLTDSYMTQGTAIAKQRLALSAYRLAALIEARLGE